MGGAQTPRKGHPYFSELTNSYRRCKVTVPAGLWCCCVTGREPPPCPLCSHPNTINMPRCRAKGCAACSWPLPSWLLSCLCALLPEQLQPAWPAWLWGQPGRQRSPAGQGHIHATLRLASVSRLRSPKSCCKQSPWRRQGLLTHSRPEPHIRCCQQCWERPAQSRRGARFLLAWEFWSTSDTETSPVHVSVIL